MTKSSIFKLFALSVIMSSCSSNLSHDGMDEHNEITSPPTVYMDEAIIRNIPSDNMYPELFSYVTSPKFDSDKSIKRNYGYKSIEWDMDAAVEYTDIDGGIQAQMIPSKDNAKYVICTYHIDKTDITDTIILQNNLDGTYFLKTPDFIPISKLKYYNSTSIVECIEVLDGASIKTHVCTGLMTVLGYEVSIILAVPSGGTSLVFGILWGVVTNEVC